MLAADPAHPANLVFSPASVAIAMSMVLIGAHGETASQLADALHATDVASSAVAMCSLVAGFRARTQTLPNPRDDAGDDLGDDLGDDPVQVVVAIANSLWVQSGLVIEQAFLDVLATEHGTGLQSVDYAADPEAARRTINAWVGDATQDRILGLLRDGAVTDETKLTLVNAVYMKAPWLHPFTGTATGPAAFTTSAGIVVQSPAMRVIDRFAYVAGAGYRAVELPYVGGELSMLVVLPDTDRSLSIAVAAVIGMDPAALTSALVSVSLPTFDIQASAGLADALTALGIIDAFDAQRADLGGIAVVRPPLHITGVAHQANITVDEHGTEAAAATAVMVAGGAAAPQDEPIDFTVERPFVFAVRDNPSGAILFLGHVGDPTQARR